MTSPEDARGQTPPIDGPDVPQAQGSPLPASAIDGPGASQPEMPPLPASASGADQANEADE
ncbi:MAG TPA: hypothetical protein VF812_10515, partial [Ktedonobacterales bacterium]